jgi:hypothetical protein
MGRHPTHPIHPDHQSGDGAAVRFAGELIPRRLQLFSQLADAALAELEHLGHTAGLLDRRQLQRDAAVTELGDSLAGQNGRKGQIEFAELGEPGKGAAGSAAASNFCPFLLNSGSC